MRTQPPNIAFEADAVTRPRRFAVLSVAGAAQVERYYARANFGMTFFAIISIAARMVFCSRVAKLIMNMR